VPRYGHSAVDRNRVKRQLRELIRLDVLPVLPAMDIVLKAAPKGYDRSFDELRDEVRKMTRQLSAQLADVLKRPAVYAEGVKEELPAT
jgi:ribonuclease P protein component